MAVILSIGLPVAAAPQVVLNEIMFDPPYDERNNEFIEIYNTSASQAVNLAGWMISDGSGVDLIKSAGTGTILEPGQYGVIFTSGYFSDSRFYDNVIPLSALVLQVDGTTLGARGLSNTSPETIFILDAAGDSTDTHTYTLGNEEGFSDERIHPKHDSWIDGCCWGGTPGFQNSVYSEEQNERVILNIDPNPFSPDGDGYEDVTEIRYRLPFLRGTILLSIYTMEGKQLRVLASGQRSGSTGCYSWTGRNEEERLVRRGIYIVVLCASEYGGSDTVCVRKTVVVAL